MELLNKKTKFWSHLPFFGEGLAGSTAFSSAFLSLPGHAQILTSTARRPSTFWLQPIKTTLVHLRDQLSSEWRFIAFDKSLLGSLA